MGTLDKLKLSKQLLTSMTNNGYLSPTELQAILFPRLHGGQDIVAIGPDGCGKTTTCVLASLNKITYTEEIAPRVLYLVPDIETGEEVLDQFHTLNRNRDLRFLGLFADGSSLDQQVLELTDGVDIIVATPDRARAAYLKLGLNLNKILLFVIDDADLIIKKGLVLPTTELVRGIKKSQFLVCSAVSHERLEKLYNGFIPLANVIEVEDLGDNQMNTVEQLLYHVPNFGTKLYLIQLLMEDKDVFDKVLIFTNTRFTAETVYKNLAKDFKDETAVYLPAHFTENTFSQLIDFKLSPKSRILVIANEDVDDLDVSDFPCVINFDIPEDTLTYTQRVLLRTEAQKEQLAITFCTDLELSQIRRLEQKQGKKIQPVKLPEDLYIVKDKPKKTSEDENN
ncbi:DEAD/DEAH box helicase [Pedobacter arcticus]|uniref:DEAD/DEAH box helicase n=1 Tax=Pedobacter arcticus TaxID=752140 RepID=UPI0002DE9230|nr:DEAD/DEAH box helicase [Pedobacter arcticus]